MALLAAFYSVLDFRSSGRSSGRVFQKDFRISGRVFRKHFRSSGRVSRKHFRSSERVFRKHLRSSRRIFRKGLPEALPVFRKGLPEALPGLPKIDKFAICRHSSQTSDDCNSVIAYDRKTLRPSLETARSALFIEIKRSLLVQRNLERSMREVVALYKIEISSFCMKQRIKDADYICVAKNTSKHTNFNSIYSCHFSLINFFINNEQTSIRPMTNRQSSTRPISISINVFTTQAITSTYLHSINNLNIFTGYNKLCLRGGGRHHLVRPPS